MLPKHIIDFFQQLALKRVDLVNGACSLRLHSLGVLSISVRSWAPKVAGLHFVTHSRGLKAILSAWEAL